MKLLLENWRKYLEEDALEEGLLDFFKKKEEEGEEVVPPIPKAYIKTLRSARSRRMRHLDPQDSYNLPYINWLHNKHTPWMRELELSADNNTLSLKTAQKIADRLLSVEWHRHHHPINQEAMEKARERIKSDFNDLFVRLGAQQGGLSVLPPEEGEGALSYADSEGGLSMTEEVKYGGILKLKPTPEIISQAKAAMANLPPEAARLPDKALHITLIHQDILKPYREKIKGMALPPEPEVVLNNEVEAIEDEEYKDPSIEGGRKSWRIRVADQSQEDLREYVNEVMALVKGPPDPEPNRIFHITLANLTGNAGDSVK